VGRLPGNSLHARRLRASQGLYTMKIVPLATSSVSGISRCMLHDVRSLGQLWGQISLHVHQGALSRRRVAHQSPSCVCGVGTTFHLGAGEAGQPPRTFECSLQAPYKRGVLLVSIFTPFVRKFAQTHAANYSLRPVIWIVLSLSLTSFNRPGTHHP
jgi:hypothetical protein